MAQPMDDEVRRRVWAGSVPLMISLHPDDVTTTSSPEPFYVLAPRVSYLPLVTEPAKQQFAQFVPDVLDEPWLHTEDDTPLRWQLPVGVLFDMHAGGQVPWKLTLRFTQHPRAQLLSCPDLSAVESAFMNALKESDFLQHGSAKRIMALSKADQTQVWRSVLSLDFDQHQRVRELFASDARAIRNVPMRLLRAGSAPLQRPCSPLAEDGSDHLLRDALQALGQAEDTRVLVQGIVPPPDTPLPWLYQHCACPDGFLYLVATAPVQ